MIAQYGHVWWRIGGARWLMHTFDGRVAVGVQQKGGIRFGVAARAIVEKVSDVLDDQLDGH